jgi:ribosome-binding factor A
MAKRNTSTSPTQRQLRAGENIRHVLVAILRKGEIREPALVDKSITVGEVRMSPDLKHATIFVAALGIHDVVEITVALNKVSKYLRGEVGRALESKYTPELKFLADTSYDAALKMNELFNDPRVRADLDRVEEEVPPQSLRDHDRIRSNPASGASTGPVLTPPATGPAPKGSEGGH